MKIKKLLALLLSLVMLFGVLAVIPVSAAEAVDSGYIFRAYEAEKHPDWVAAPTVDGYDARYTIDATYAITTNKTYDMGKNVIRLNSVTPPADNANSVVVVISPDNYNGFTTKHDVDNGKLTFVLTFNYNGGTYTRVWCEGKYEGLDKLIAGADTYEFSFSKSESFDENNLPTTAYNLQINEFSIKTTDEEHWLARFMNSDSFTASNVTIGTNQRAVFNATIEDNRGFTASDSNSTGTITAVTEDGYSTMTLDGRVAATVQSFDFTDKTLSVRPKWGTSNGYHFYASAVSITFASERRDVNKAISGADTLCLLFSPTNNDNTRKSLFVSNTDSGSINVWQNEEGYNRTNFLKLQTASYNGTDYSGKEEYNFSFINIGTNKWALVINDVYYEHDSINAFCNAGGLEDAYVTVAGAFGFSASAKVIDRNIADWACNNKNGVSVVKNTFEDGSKKLDTQYQSPHMTTKKVNLFETTVELDDISYNSAISCIKVGFAPEYGLATKHGSTADNLLMFDFYVWPVTGGADKNVYEIKLDNSSLGTVKVLKGEKYNLKFNFVDNGDGTYSVFANNKEVKSDKINAFCAAYADNCYVSVVGYAARLTVNPKLNKITDNHELAVDGVAVADNTLKNVAANKTVADVIANVTVGEYYTAAITDSEGFELAEDAAVGSGYKLAISYRGALVESAAHEIIVLGDTNGDAAVTADDVVVIKKELLGVAVNDIYRGALNACYDNAFNILDYIAATKSIVD